MKALIALCVLAACGRSGDDDAQSDAAPTRETDPFADLPSGQQQHDIVCARGNGDTVALAFCASSTQPPIASLVDLQRLLGLDIKPGQVLNGQGGNPAFALT